MRLINDLGLRPMDGGCQMIKAVILDLDGTILDSVGALWRAFNAGVSHFGLPSVARERLLELMGEGIGLPDMLSNIYRELTTEPGIKMVDEIGREMRRAYLAGGGGEEAGFVEGARELLDQLKSKGMKIGIVTGRTIATERQWQQLARLNIAHLIDTVVTAVAAPRKPAPDTINAYLAELGLLPDECISVGDSAADIVAGKAAGVRTVAVATGVTPSRVLSAKSPDFMFSNLYQLMDNLDYILGQQTGGQV